MTSAVPGRILATPIASDDGRHRLISVGRAGCGWSLTLSLTEVQDVRKQLDDLTRLIHAMEFACGRAPATLELWLSDLEDGGWGS